jgi:hypothetical protein
VADPATSEPAGRGRSGIDPRQMRHQQALVSREFRRLARGQGTRRPVGAGVEAAAVGQDLSRAIAKGRGSGADQVPYTLYW